MTGEKAIHQFGGFFLVARKKVAVSINCDSDRGVAHEGRNELHVDACLDRKAGKARVSAKPREEQTLLPPKGERTWFDYFRLAGQIGVVLVLFAPLIPIYLLVFLLFGVLGFRYDEFSLTPVDRDFSRDRRLSNPRLRNYG